MILQTLNNIAIPRFESMIPRHALFRTRDKLEIMQVNVGRLCNLSCKHCHMEAGPHRTESMDKSVMDACLTVMRDNNFDTVDITGGAPEMNPHFRWFAVCAKEICRRVIVRTNLVILLEHGYEDLPELYHELGVEIVCSLPHYTAQNTDKMRGSDVFRRSIEVLTRLNKLGYGIDVDLPLNLVFNPGGAFLPPRQLDAERDFRRRLRQEHGVEFTNLLTITNNPVGRFADFLIRSENLQNYMTKLYSAFNPLTLEDMMCRNQISVASDGKLYDCDFNQAAELPINSGETIFDWQGKPINNRSICFGQHCYACTAGQGSSCGGAIG